MMTKQNTGNVEQLVWHALDVTRGTRAGRDGMVSLLGVMMLRYLCVRAEPADQAGPVRSGHFMLPKEARWSRVMEDNGHAGVTRAVEALTHPAENAELAWVIRNLRVVDALATDEMGLAAFGFAQALNEVDLTASEWSRAFDALIDKQVELIGVEGGQYRTPGAICDLMVRLLSPRSGASIYDPTCGTGELLSEVRSAACSTEQAGPQPAVWGQEINLFIAALAKLRFIVNGLPPENIAVGDTLLDPLFLDNGGLRKYDFVVADLPIGTRLSQEAQMRLGSDPYGRMQFGPPGARAESAFLQHVVASLQPGGRAVVLTTPSLLFASDNARVVRQGLVESGRVQAVVSLPLGMLKYANVATCVVVLREPGDTNQRVAFVRAVLSGRRGRTGSALAAEDVERIAHAVANLSAEPGFSVAVGCDSIRNADYLLEPNRYLQQEKPRRFMGADVEWKHLGDIAAVTLGVKVNSQLLNAESEAGTPVVRSRDLSAAVLSADILSRPQLPAQPDATGAISTGDVLLQRIGASPRAAFAGEELNGLLAIDSVYVIRLKQPHRDMGIFLAEYLNSDVGQEQVRTLSRGSAAPTIRLVDLKKLPVPIPPSGTTVTLANVVKAESRLRQRLTEASETKRRLLVAEDPDEVDALLRHLSTESSVVAASVEQANDLDFQLRNYYPFPIAYSYGLLEPIDVPAERYQELMRVAENTLAYLASIGLAAAVSRMPDQVRQSAHLARDPLLSCWQGGISPGDWVTIARESARILRGQNQPAAIVAYANLWFRGTGQRQSEFAATADSLKERINDFKHGRGPRVEPEHKAQCELGLVKLRALLEEIGFLVQHPLRLVRSMEAHWRSDRTTIKTLVYRGDRPGMKQETVEYGKALARDKLYLQLAADDWLPLYPLVSVQFCPTCSMRETYMIDKWAGPGQKAVMKSYERGHTIDSAAGTAEAAEFGADLAAWLDGLSADSKVV